MAVRRASVIDGRRETTPPAARISARTLLRQRDFRLLWAGQSISRLGDQFYLIALPWLVLQRTGSAVEMGTVLALEGATRALFMLVGGAVTDRFSPRAVILTSYLSRFVVVGSLALVVALSTVPLWLIYITALLFGLADAFHVPAQGAIVARGITRDHLDIVNMLNQGASQLSMSVGPVVAGATIAVVGGRGTGLAMSVDAVSFAVGAWLIARMRVAPPLGDPWEGSDYSRMRPIPTEKPARVGASIREGLSYVWHDPPLRHLVPLFSAISVFVDGPFAVGAPVIGHNRFSQGAAAFGIVASAFGCGMLAGTVLGGLRPRSPQAAIGNRLFVVTGALGVSTALFGMASVIWLAAASALVMGVTNGYVVIIFVTWIQRRTSDAMMGRMMSILMMVSVGLNPLSTAVAGAVAGINVTALLVGSGMALIVVVLVAALSPAARDLDACEVGDPGDLPAIPLM